MNRISFCGSESTGSVAKRDFNQFHTIKYAQPQSEVIADSVSFKGREEKNSSALTKGLACIVTAGLAFVGLAYTHKADLVGKLSDGKFKDFMRKSDKITKPCHDLCHKIKSFVTKKS